MRSKERCACGLPLHYTNKETEAQVKKMVAELGEFMPVHVGTDKYMVQRHGGIGRHAWFRAMCPQGRTGSSPVCGIISEANMTEDKLEAICGMPVDRSRFAKLNLPEVPPWEPGPGWQQAECQHCHEPCWIGPKQQEKVKESVLPVMCIICIALIGKAWKEKGEEVVLDTHRLSDE